MSTPNDEDLRRILTTAETIAVVGASANPERPSHAIFQRLLRQGYRVVPVNPLETEILGQKSYPDLASIPFHVDIVDVFRRSDQVRPIAEEAVRIGAGTLWLQSGIQDEPSETLAREGGLEVVSNHCIAVALATLGIPARV